MTNEALMVLDVVSQSVFRLFTTWYIPGTNVTPAVAFFGILFFFLMIRVLRQLFDIFTR